MKQNLSFEIKEDKDYNLLKIKVNDDEYYPDQISAMVLKKIVTDSEYYLSKILGKEIKIKNSVITAPAYFNHRQRKAIINAANIINLNVKRIINEPTAASLAYLYKNLSNIKKNIIVFDFGGGTFDITLLNLEQSKEGSYCDIKCTGGDPNFGGEDFDEILMKKCIEKIWNKYDINLDIDKKLYQNIRLKRACENAKIILSKDNDTKIILQEYLPSINIDFSLTREEFECFCESLFKKFEKIIDEFLKDNNVNKEDISEVIPIGGSTLIPRIKGIIRSKFKDSKINDTLNPHEVVAIGAGIQGGLLSGLENLTSYNLLDITNYSLGVEIVGEKMSKIIKKYTHIPIQYYSSYHNEYDYPEFLSIKVYEGEDENNIKNDIFLGEFKIGNLPRKKAKEINITVVFDIDKNSILNVKAIEEANKDNVEEKYINLKKNNEPNDLNKEFVVEEQKGLMEIINKLRDKENSLEYVEIKPYSMILKDFIIEEENEIYKLKERKEKNKELIKQKNKLIIEKLKIMKKNYFYLI